MDQFISKLEEMEKTYRELDEQLSDPAVIGDQAKFKRLAKARHQLEKTVSVYHEWQAVQSHLQGAQEILRTETDKDLRELAEQEVCELKERDSQLKDRLRLLLLPRDPNDEKDIMLEIRGGTGGDEASLFAGDLLRLYLKYADRMGWTVEIVSASAGELGGYKEVIANVRV
jgi:peptide chain release factor 1